VKGRERLFRAAEWHEDKPLASKDIFEALHENDRVSLPVVGGTPQQGPVPPLAAPPEGAAHTLSATYDRPYNMHASLAPSAAAALFDGARLTVWSHSQGIYPLRGVLAEALEMNPDDIHVIHVPGAGCYGHNGADDVAFDAALVARAIAGKPVLLKWTREDEHAWEPYGSCMSMGLSGSLDAEGNVLAWSHETFSDTHIARPGFGPSGASLLLASRYRAEPLEPPLPQPAIGPHVGIHRNQEVLYTFPATRYVKHLVRDLPLRVSALRTLGAYGNVFAIESFIDELAEAAGLDAVEFRLRNLADERAKAVIRAAADALGPLDAAVGEGRGRGVAFARYKNTKTYAAVGIELEVNDKAEVKLLRGVIAGDAGQVVDPNGLIAQLEGGLIQAASWTLFETVTFDAGGITSRDWESYPILTFDNVPRIETILVNRPDEPFLGAGEAAAGPTAGAIANALYRATGLRLRRLPFTPDTIRRAALT
jgi:nicotinate dehydrogenase subunit B